MRTPRPLHSSLAPVMRLLVLSCALVAASTASAQPPGRAPQTPPAAPAPAAPAAEEEEFEEDLDETLEDDAEENAIEDEGDEPRLRAPVAEPPALEPIEEEDEDGFVDEDVADATPADDADLLGEGAPPSSDPTVAVPTAPQPILSLHGYFRTRGEIWDNFFLGRDDAPFNYFVPADRNAAGRDTIMGPDGPDEVPCDSCASSDRLRFANMRLRLAPTFSLSDEVQVHAMFDVFDNLVLGSTPDGVAYTPVGGPGGSPGQFDRDARTPGVPIDSFSSTQNPPQALTNSARDSIYVRRAWAQVTNRQIGQLRFGRMGSHWGLGILANGGDGIDSDYSSDVDRIMYIGKLFGVYGFAAYDFASQGLQRQLTNDLRGIPFDATAKDDVRQYVFGLAYRQDEQPAQERLQSGGWVLEGGAYFVTRSQFLSSAGVTNAFPSRADDFFVRRDARAYIPDLWGRFRMGGLRLEVEAAAVIGSIRNIENDVFRDEDYNLLQFGVAFEGEYRTLNDKLSISLYTGYASGDPDIEGLSSRQGLLVQQTGDRRISNFQFHPNYRIDLILWRNILERVSGAWYLRPGVSYDLVRNPFGRLLGVRADVIYSRAAAEVQTYGSDPNLGVELDLALYYRSEDGPEILDGFYASFQYGVLFPLDGLGTPDAGNDNLSRAQSIRLILGVQY